MWQFCVISIKITYFFIIKDIILPQLLFILPIKGGSEMKRINKILIVVLALLTFTAALITAYAFGRGTPAEIIGELTGKSPEEIAEQRFTTGKTIGEIAYDEGLWEEFRNKMLENRKAFLDEKVKEGILTEDEKEEIYSYFKTMQEYCRRTGGWGIRNKDNINGMERGLGNGRGMMGFGFGRGCRGSW